MAVIKVVFDTTGACTAFDILEMHPGEKLREHEFKRGDGMKDRFTPGIEEVLDLLGNYGTPEVLEYINDYPQCTKGELETLVENTTVTTLMGRLQQKELVTEELKLTDEGPQKRSGKHDTGTVIFLKVDSRRLSTLQGMKPP